MRTPKQIRLLGVVQLLMGLFLIGLMGTITFYLAPQMLNPDEADAGSTFTGTAAQAKVILILFGLVIAFGAGSALSGVLQIVSGRRNRRIAFVAVCLGAVLLIFAHALELFL